MSIVWKWSTTSRSVDAVMSMLSHIVNSMSRYLRLRADGGSNAAYWLMPRFTFVSRKSSMGLRLTILYSSSMTRPVASAVVVAIAGTMRPTICFACMRSASGMRY